MRRFVFMAATVVAAPFFVIGPVRTDPQQPLALTATIGSEQFQAQFVSVTPPGIY